MMDRTVLLSWEAVAEGKRIQSLDAEGLVWNSVTRNKVEIIQLFRNSHCLIPISGKNYSEFRIKLST